MTERQYAMMLGNGYCVPVVSRILVGMIKATGFVRGVRDPFHGLNRLAGVPRASAQINMLPGSRIVGIHRAVSLTT